MVSAKPTNLAKQWRQQSPQTPSTHKPKTSNHGSHASTNSQTFQTHKIFITSPLWLSDNLPPTTHNRPKPTIQTKTYKTPTHLQKTHIIYHRSKSKLTHYKTHNHGATTKIKREVKSVNLPPRCHWTDEVRFRGYGLKGQRKIEKSTGEIDGEWRKRWPELDNPDEAREILISLFLLI